MLYIFYNSLAEGAGERERESESESVCVGQESVYMLIYQSSIKARVTDYYTDYRVNNQTKGKSIHQCNSKQRTPSQQQPIEFAEMKKDQRYRLVIGVNNVWLYKGAEKEDRGGEKSSFRRGDTPYPQGTYPALSRKPPTSYRQSYII